MIHILPETTPKPLQSGDEVITIAISSALEDDKQLVEGIKVLESWGLKPRKHQSLIGRRWGYLAGNDSIRYSDLHQQKPAELISFAKGGWGSARLLDRPQPWKKGWLLGYSDITSILLARLASGFDGCVHGPLINSLGEEPTWSQERLKALLFGEPVKDICGEPWIEGLATGPLVVANLTVSSHLIGSKHFPNLQGAILILEDIDEEPYRIDRMLTQWRLAGLLNGLSGLGFGDFKDCKSKEDIPENQTFQLEEVLKERSKDLGIPVIGNLPVGHCKGNAALPLGRTAILDGSNGFLKLPTF